MGKKKSVVLLVLISIVLVALVFMSVASFAVPSTVKNFNSFLSVIDFYELQRKLNHHKAYADKIITFEFSHFLSPQSINLAAHNLNKLYTEEYLK